MSVKVYPCGFLEKLIIDGDKFLHDPFETEFEISDINNAKLIVKDGKSAELGLIVRTKDSPSEKVLHFNFKAKKVDISEIQRLYDRIVSQRPSMGDMDFEEHKKQVEAAEKENAKRRLVDKMFSICSYEDIFSENHFVVSKEVEVNYFENNKGKMQRFFVDDASKRFAIAGNDVQIYNFSDILDFELNEDGNSIMRGKGMATALGAATLGLPGALMGAAGKRESVGTCTSLLVRISLNNLKTPQVVIPLINGTEIKKDTYYQSYFETAKELMSTLAYIANQNDANEIKDSSVSSASGADEILKFKNLLDSGIITQEEFDAKKQQILGF